LYKNNQDNIYLIYITRAQPDNLKQKQNKNNTTAQDRVLHRNQEKDRSSKEKYGLPRRGWTVRVRALGWRPASSRFLGGTS
jgi:hypothetical protein